jgi:WD40 repeat protein
LQFSNAVDALNLGTGKAAVLPKTPGYNYYVNHMAFDAASRHVVIAYNSGTAWEWALPHSSGSPLFVGAFRDPVANAVLWDAEFSPNGRELALADNFGNVTVFNTATKRQALPEPLNAGSGQVNSAVFGEGGKTVLTSGDDGTARVWDLATRRLLLSIGPSDEPYPSAVNSAVYGDLGGDKVLLLGSNDGFLRVWSTQAATPNLHELEALARERLGGRCYTSAELAEFSNPSQVSSSCRHG